MSHPSAWVVLMMVIGKRFTPTFELEKKKIKKTRKNWSDDRFWSYECFCHIRFRINGWGDKKKNQKSRSKLLFLMWIWKLLFPSFSLRPFQCIGETAESSSHAYFIHPMLISIGNYAYQPSSFHIHNIQEFFSSSSFSFCLHSPIFLYWITNSTYVRCVCKREELQCRENLHFTENSLPPFFIIIKFIMWKKKKNRWRNDVNQRQCGLVQQDTAPTVITTTTTTSTTGGRGRIRRDTANNAWRFVCTLHM